MNGISLKQLDDESLIKRFAYTADKLGNAINLWESGVKETNQLFAITDEIRARGSQTERKLLPLLDSENRFVRYYAAQRLLLFAPDRCRRIIKENVNNAMRWLVMPVCFCTF